MKKTKETLLFTGGTGFLGSNILHTIIKDDYKLIVLKRSRSNINRIKDLAGRLILFDLDLIDLEQVLKQHHIDKIVHCATNYGRTVSNPLEIMEANLMLPLRLLELGKKYRVNCFINTDTILDKGINYYTLSKSQFRQWLEAYAADSVCINIELEHFYGPFDDESKFVSNIIHKLLSKVEQIDLTEGKQKRSFIYIDDAVKAFVKIIDNSHSLNKGFYNYQVGSEEKVAIREFVEMAKKLTNNNKTKLNFGALLYRENEIMNPRLDLAKLTALGWQPGISLAEGLAKMIEIERKGWPQ
ncbi:MAG: NAD(P)-dependent oxidoreductase [Elusimicrobia bacterium]|nr:NAD(P)-dependent oxidoreductase [Elusimicrobiota bacterium]